MSAMGRAIDCVAQRRPMEWTAEFRRSVAAWIGRVTFKRAERLTGIHRTNLSRYVHGHQVPTERSRLDLIAAMILESGDPGRIL